MQAYFSSKYAQYVVCWMFSGHLEFLKQRKIGNRNKLLPSGWVRDRKDEGEGMGKEIFFSFLLFPFSFQHPSNTVTQ